jgi:glutamate/tyrosine decarboxylase-like PLP-dependent enzyme
METTIDLPETGNAKDAILAELAARKAGDADWKGAKTWSLVYYLDEEHDDFIKRAYELYFSENALNPMAFKSLRRMEHEVVRMAASLLRGDAETVGVMSSGGTESCLLAVKAWRDWARAKKPFLRRPEIVLAESAHVAWFKGAEYFDVKPVVVPVDGDFRMDVAEAARRIGKNTVLVVASAPDYPHGLVDPIEELGRVAEEKGVPLHVDACLGGFFLPFMEALGRPVPAWDFRVRGVKSISADVHKYAFAAKGASVILYRDMDYLEKQFFQKDDWPGGVFISPALLGTRPGGAIAAAWAALMATGRAGYREMARATLDAADRLRAGIAAIPGLKLVGSPTGSIFSFGSAEKGLDIFAVGDQMEKRGWHVDRLQKPEALHAMVTPRHGAVADAYLDDLAASVAAVRADPRLARQGDAAMYGMIARVPLRGLVRDGVRKLMRNLYGSECVMPGSDALGTDGTEERP